MVPIPIHCQIRIQIRQSARACPIQFHIQVKRGVHIKARPEDLTTCLREQVSGAKPPACIALEVKPKRRRCAAGVSTGESIRHMCIEQKDASISGKGCSILPLQPCPRIETDFLRSIGIAAQIDPG